MPDQKQESLRTLPSVTELLKSETVAGWLRQHPQPLVTECLRRAIAGLRQQILDDTTDHGDTQPITPEAVLAQAAKFLQRAIEPHVREAVNATGIILHTGLGRAVLPESVVDSMMGELKGYCTLAVDRESGGRAERDELVEYLLTELTGAEAATVVNNNAAATMLVLAALAAPREVIVSRGQLIEIGGSFRLPEVMAQSGARLVEVGATNRTHPRDYQNAVTENTAAILRAHPSNYRVVGFTSEVPLRELAELAHGRNLVLIDDLGAGALLDLEQFGLPHEPTVRESIEAGADVVLFSGDKLIGAGQCGVIVGRKALIGKLRKHPLMRAVRVDKTCLMVLERTLQLFRDPARLPREHPTYRMISTSMDALKSRAQKLARQISAEASKARVEIADSRAFLGSGSLPTEAIPSFVVTVSLPEMSASEQARRLRLDRACVFGRIENDRVCLDVRTLTDEQVPLVAAAVGRIGLEMPKAEG
ncbi:MAG: L-seryl-tRNA(Sec) selenium transferase [Verrucomicrobiota bacterium]|jgi:L-seryl-tRNA(Ser) seleniumtransferase